MRHKSKEITIYDIAQALELSPATVSRGLQNHPLIKEETKQRILEKALALGYRRNTIASNLRTQKTHTIGVIVHELNSNFITSVLAGIEKITTQAGYDIIIAHSYENYTKEVANANNLFQKRVDGIITSLAFDTPNLDHYRQFEEKGIPVVFFDRVEENSDSVKVIIDNYRAGYQATEHLIAQGCKRIVLVTANLQRNVYFKRYAGYKDALSAHQLPFEEQYVLIKDLSEQCGVEAALHILSMNPLPDGVFITNDFSAAVCMQTLKEHGIRIPEDIAVVGFNNDAIGKIIEPKLTTIDYPGIEMGEIAAKNVIDQLQEEATTQHISTIVVRSELMVRASSVKKEHI